MANGKTHFEGAERLLNKAELQMVEAVNDQQIDMMLPVISMAIAAAGVHAALAEVAARAGEW